MTEYKLTQQDSRAGLKLSERTRLLVLALLPFILLAAIIAIFLATNAGLQAASTLPPGDLAFERVILRPEEIVVQIVNSGNSDLTIALATVDDAIWEFRIEPAATLKRLERANLALKYPWLENERHEIKLITADGLVFSREIPLAVLSPEPSSALFASFGLVGVYVGVIPIGLGLMWFPFLRRMGKRALDFLLSLTVGLLIFLGVEALAEALEIADRVARPFQGMGLVTIGVVVSFLAIVAVGHSSRGRARDEAGQRLLLAYLIALGIGLHNFGEGLAIGAAYAAGAIAFGAFLVVGFALHNVTEGFGIVAPLARPHPESGAGARPSLKHFTALGLLGGAPAILGTWIGGFVYSDIWATLFFAMGAGAIFQVVYEIAKLLGKESDARTWNPTNVSGLVTGLGIMYLTGLLV